MKKISLFVVVLALTTLSTRAQYYYSYEKRFRLIQPTSLLYPIIFRLVLIV